MKQMVSRLARVRHLHDYVLELSFEDGRVAEVDFRDRIVGRGGVFAPLEDVNYFRQASVEADFGALVWPNEVDFCPEMLHQLASETVAR